MPRYTWALRGAERVIGPRFARTRWHLCPSCACSSTRAKRRAAPWAQRSILIYKLSVVLRRDKLTIGTVEALRLVFVSGDIPGTVKTVDLRFAVQAMEI